ncbi:Serine acetyltransferase [Flavobacterium sp. ACN2]|nr:Serine acetyltransferase [Flavobacterium sp. ACN2]
MFNTLVKINCHSKNRFLKLIAGNLLEKLYCCEINCAEMDKSVLFAHHGRGCTIVASKICENVVIFQNVSIGANLKYNKISKEWENVGSPIVAKNVVIADGAKILGPVVIGENSVIGAGSIITKDIPPNSVAFGVNKFKPKDVNYDFIFNPNMIHPSKIIEANKNLVNEFNKQNKSV